MLSPPPANPLRESSILRLPILSKNLPETISEAILLFATIWLKGVPIALVTLLSAELLSWPAIAVGDIFLNPEITLCIDDVSVAFLIKFEPILDFAFKPLSTSPTFRSLVIFLNELAAMFEFIFKLPNMEPTFKSCVRLFIWLAPTLDLDFKLSNASWTFWFSFCCWASDDTCSDCFFKLSIVAPEPDPSAPNFPSIDPPPGISPPPVVVVVPCSTLPSFPAPVSAKFWPPVPSFFVPRVPSVGAGVDFLNSSAWSDFGP